ncbi:MAG: tRNA epoxyqueuosine(34) reductase QueG [Spirochaetia bacterium]|nr:tRNA epoxyqueuosine(34) reductase QueG [Spirochaetia bacterium]
MSGSSADLDVRERIRETALAAGYDLAGFSSPKLHEDDKVRLTEFAEACAGSSMEWMRESLPLRLDITRIFAAVESVLVLGTVYRTSAYDEALSKGRRRVARYAAGREYHKTLRKKGARLIQEIQKIAPDARARVVVDSAPAPEKVFARYAGIGWQGKNTNIIHPEKGSYFFLSLVFLNLNLAPDAPMADHCAQCNKCVEACPTGALRPYEIDPLSCISYWTIEARTAIPESISSRLNQWVFGCDICQEVCPFNRKPSARACQSRETRLHASPLVLDLIACPDIPSETDWKEKTKGHALARAPYANFKQAWSSADGKEPN